MPAIIDVTLKTDTKLLQTLLKQMEAAKNVWVDAGFFQGMYKPVEKKSTKKSKKELLTPAQKAIVNEFGVPGKIPARPFMRNTFRNNRNFVATLQKNVTAVVQDNVPVSKALVLVGEKVRKEITLEINALQEPANAPSTIARKGSSKPLIDTAEMRNNVNYRLNTE